MSLPALTGLSPDALAAWLKDAGEPSFRAGQILEWVWKKKVVSFDAMTNLPTGLRDKLAANFRLGALTHTATRSQSECVE